MTDVIEFVDAMDARAQRRAERRDLFKAALGVVAVGAGGFAFATAAQAQAVTDADILNFALNLEYLEAQFYLYALNGAGLPANQLTGMGTQGGVVLTGTAPPRAVNFTGEPVIRQYAREIAADEAAHVAFLRTALGNAAVAQPAINISGGLNADGTPGAFSLAARASGIATSDGTLTGTPSATGTFDPYSSPDAFLLGSFIFEDVGVTAYKGASPLITSKVFLDAAAGILAVEAYHAAIVRTALYARGATAPALRTASDRISDARDTVDGAPPLDAVRGIGPDDDQGVSPVTILGGTASNIAPLNENGLAYSRSAAQTLNVVYLNRASVTGGGFFPAGVNGTIRASAAN
jgi:hypothetical protein